MAPGLSPPMGRSPSTWLPSRILVEWLYREGKDTMIGNGYWAVGIVVKYRVNASGEPGWAASADYLDDGFCDDDPAQGVVSTEGKLHTRYFVNGADSETCLTAAVDAVRRDAEWLGITWKDNATIWYGHARQWPPPPGWRGMLAAQAQRLGWREAYAPETEDA